MIHNISSGTATTPSKSGPSRAQGDSFQQLLEKATSQRQPDENVHQRQDIATAQSGDDQNGQSDTVQYKTINGIDVIVAGHSLDSDKTGGLSWDIDMSVLADQEALERQLAEHPEYSQYRLTQISVEPLDGPLERLRSVGMSDGLFTLPSDVFERSMHWQRTIAELADQLVIERELQQTYGEKVKLAYSQAEGSYIMLKPGDGRYDEVTTGQDALDNLRETLALSDTSEQDTRMVREILSGAGFYL
ncbi:hypothetical protein ADIMK_2519 [Marinobacterium lacunae]|uniref:Uncharacterized protein n=1 Tax=Marinobacterium lacunae TaxID=1232683 RepID=A0A081FWU0_9GAMM|nr:hypothetical protein [Marinobacterium lacunae]KEA62995.1 hypothetical protein ADIMK_2519 [Marinobacterium lacunae]